MKLPSFFAPNPEEIEEMSQPKQKSGLFGLIKKLRNKEETLEEKEGKKKKLNKRWIVIPLTLLIITIIVASYSSKKINETINKIDPPSMKVEITLKDDVNYYLENSVLTYEELFALLKNKGYDEEEIKFELDNAKINNEPLDWEQRRLEAEEDERQSELAWQEYEKQEEERIKKEEERKNNLQSMQDVIEKNTNIKYPSSISIARTLEYNGITKITMAKVLNNTTVSVTSNNVVYEMGMSQGIVKTILNKSTNKIIFDGIKFEEKREDEELNDRIIDNQNINILVDVLNRPESVAKGINTRIRNIGIYSIDAIYMINNDGNEASFVVLTDSFIFYKMEIKDDKLQKFTNMYTNETLYVIPNEDGLETIKLI